MKRHSKIAGLAVAGILLCGILSFFGYWAYKYNSTFVIPELPDNQYYENLEERALEAQKVAHRHHLSEDYCLFIDYSIPSGTPRLFVWSFTQKKVVASTYVMHGSGMGSTAEKPVFSNRFGSNCSSLGKFEITKKHGYKLKRSFRLSGLELGNKTAFTRGLMVHRAVWVDLNCWRKYIPLNTLSCQGCITVSSRGMNYLEKLIQGQPKNLLLWSFSSKTA